MWTLPPVHEAQGAAANCGGIRWPSWSLPSSAAWRPARSALIVASFTLTLHLVGAVGESDMGLTVGAQAAPSAHHAAATERGVATQSLLFGGTDPDCIIAGQAGQPMTRAELSHLYTLGVRPGEYRDRVCAAGLVYANSAERADAAGESHPGEPESAVALGV